jgi:energy-coupling factor transporter transmembrane protein EcfT
MGLPLYAEGLEFGLTVGTRVMLLSLSILLFFTSTSLKELSFLLLNAGIPTSIVTIILLSSHLVEQLPSRISQIFSAQEARGAPVKSHIVARARSFFSVLSPLVLSSLAESIERGTALELRGFRGQLKIRKSGVEKLSFPGYVFLLLGVLALLWKVLWK